eukprot:8993997-Alexandrium_andersonii.AAC.1
MLYPDKKSKLVRERWQGTEMTDIELERGHAQGGLPPALDLLATSDVLEHPLARVGAGRRSWSTRARRCTRSC